MKPMQFVPAYVMGDYANSAGGPSARAYWVNKDATVALEVAGRSRTTVKAARRDCPFITAAALAAGAALGYVRKDDK